MSKRMDLSSLKAMLASERADALAAVVASKLSSERSDALDYYNGNMAKDMPAPEGHSFHSLWAHRQKGGTGR